MNTSVINYSYKGSEISFMSGDSTMINATQMAKSFDKRPIDYLRLPSTNELINAIVRKSHIAENQLVITERGGLNPGTWFHEDLALDFAQWLSVDFKLWCNDRIKELLRTGVTTIANDDEAILRAVQVLQQRVDDNRRQLQIAEGQLQLQAPKVLFADAVQTSHRSCLVSELAKILQQNGHPIGQNRLFEWMRSNGYLCRKGDYYNQPTQKAMDLGVFDMKQTSIAKPDGSVLVSTTTKVTGKGQIYFVNKFLSNI